MVHLDTRKVLLYPDTIGKRTAMSFFKWDKLTKDEEIMRSADIVKMAKKIDNEVTFAPRRDGRVD